MQSAVSKENVNAVIENIIIETVVNGVVAKSIIALPFLGFPVIAQIYSGLVNYVTRQVISEAFLMGLFLSIDMEQDANNREYKDATTVLRDTLKNEKATEDEIIQAENEYRNRLRDLINLN